MSFNKVNPYNIESHIPEIYDQQETETEDIKFILNLTNQYKCKNILEPFCGTGRILLPIAKNNLKITGIDNSKMMLNTLSSKINTLSEVIQKNITIIEDDVTESNWPNGFDAVLLGGNSFFELATLEEQSVIFDKAYNSIKSKGYIFIDNDNIEYELPDFWCNLNVETNSFPSGKCEDGVILKGYSMVVFVDKKNKIWKAKRRLEVFKNDKLISQYKWYIQKHPIGYPEIIDMINNYNIKILGAWSDIKTYKNYYKGAKRVTLWLQKL